MNEKNNIQDCEEEYKMDKLMMNKLDDMELDMVGGSASFPHHYRPRRPRPGCHDSNANSMAANVDETQMHIGEILQR